MNPKTSAPLLLPEGYPVLLNDIKTRLRESQIKAALAVKRTDTVLLAAWR